MASNARSNPHLDPSLSHFVSPNFSPADYLNSQLPPLHRNTTVQTDPNAVSLSNLHAKAQSLINTLNAQNTRLSNTLTQLTDEIIRGGSKLAYAVEVLRGEAIGLEDALNEKLEGDIKRLVPSGIGGLQSGVRNLSISEQGSQGEGENVPDSKDEITSDSTNLASLDPPYLQQLRTLLNVRSRLDNVIHIFGEAMEWHLPPSELSAQKPSFISVSAPEPDSTAQETQEQEEKGQECTLRFRNQITDLLSSEGGGEKGIEAAQKRVDEIRLLASLWKGTSEEKAREKIVEELQDLVDEKRRHIEEAISAREGRIQQDKVRRQTDSPGEREKEQSSLGTSTAAGLLRNLQRLRDEIYLE